MKPGVSIYGGFDDELDARARSVTEIDGVSPVVTFDNDQTCRPRSIA